MNTADKDLVRDIKAGYAPAFEKVHNRYFQPLKHISQRITNDEHYAEDIVSETLYTFKENIHKFKQASSIFTYLYRIVVNKSLDLVKKIKKETNFNNAVELTDVKISDDAEIKIIIKEAVRKLPEKFKLPLVMAEIENLPYTKISELLGIPLNTVRTRILRARKKLLHILTAMGVKL
jgi:RNA polymerase sigma-70 factor (ECF subfamily)